MCDISLLNDLLNNADAGGSWTYDGFSSVSGTGAAGSGGSTIPTLSGDNPVIDTTGYVAGFYIFTYTVGLGACQDTRSSYFHIKNVANAGNPNTVSYCTDDTDVISLFNQLGGNPAAGGVWTATGSPAGFDASAGTLDLSQQNVVETLTFTYTQALTPTNGETLAPCAQDCDNEATVTVDIQEGSEAGTATPVLVCQ